MARQATARAPEPLLEPTEFFQVGKEETGLRIYLRYDLFRALDEFAVRDTSREQAGLLVGQVQEGAEGFIVVEDAIEIGVDDGASGRFSSRSWQHARRVARSRYQDKVILGWFHTHPGTGLELSSEEREVHTTFFPEKWQVVYVVDPVSRDRNFYNPGDGGKLTAARGFRIYGKESPVGLPAGSQERSNPPAAPPKPPDDHLRERYLERSLEKIQRSLRRPPVRPVDYAILALLVVNLLWTTFRPMPPVQVDNREITANQQKMLDQVTALSDRIVKLEQHLAALQVLDEELAINPTPKAPDTQPVPLLPPPAQQQETPAAPAPPAPEGRMVKLHKVKDGDTLSIITEKYYGSSASKYVTALATFNKLKPPNFDIFPGDVLKVPSKESLKL